MREAKFSTGFMPYESMSISLAAEDGIDLVRMVIMQDAGLVLWTVHMPPRLPYAIGAPTKTVGPTTHGESNEYGKAVEQAAISVNSFFGYRGHQVSVRDITAAWYEHQSETLAEAAIARS